MQQIESRRESRGSIFIHKHEDRSCTDDVKVCLNIAGLGDVYERTTDTRNSSFRIQNVQWYSPTMNKPHAAPIG